MSGDDRPHINGSFSGNINSGNISNVVFAGDGTNVPWHPMLGHPFFSDMMKGRADSGEFSKAEQKRPTEPHVRTQPEVPNPIHSDKLGSNNVTGNAAFFTGGAIFREPRDKTPEPAPEEPEGYGAPVREPPAWKLLCKIGSGTFGTVFLEKVQTRGMESPELWAVKQISKAIPNFPAKQYQAEIRNLQALSKYDWFVKFNTSYEDRHYVYIAMEYIPIGDLSKTFVKRYRWNESDTKVVIEQLLRGLVAMHKEGITHRDLKPENIFLCLPDNQTCALRIKIGDFGASKRIPLHGSSTLLKTTTGTVDYMAPEMDDTEHAEEPKTNRVDIWSLGCILYRMVAGKTLFDGRQAVWKYSMRDSSPPPEVEKLGFSVPCMDFLRGVLQPSQKHRLSAEKCLEMAWIMNRTPISEYSISKDLYLRLKRIRLDAPDIDSFSEVVANVEESHTPAGSLPTAATPMTGSTGSSSRTTETAGPGSPYSHR